MTMKTMRMTSNSSSSWEEKKNMGLLINIIPPTSSITTTTTTNEWSQDHQESDFLPARGRGEEVMLKQMKAQHPLGQAPHQDQGLLRCPRCNSSNTKFCYYNNYSLSQPRHFCKSCKRYWTRGGTLRNVPVGGGCRKNKRVNRPSPAVVTSNTPASCASDGNAPAIFSSGDPHELDLTYAALGFSSRNGGNDVGNFIRDFIMNPSENVPAVDWSVPQPGQFDEIGLSDLPPPCWNTFANGMNSSWTHNESGNNAGSSITSLI